jgi:hypothetical protein
MTIDRQSHEGIVKQPAVIDSDEFEAIRAAAARVINGGLISVEDDGVYCSSKSLSVMGMLCNHARIQLNFDGKLTWMDK